jgi:hypothetical protein
MKTGTLCKVTAENSHSPSQFGNLIVVCEQRKTRTGGHVVTGINLNTGRKHHYFSNEIKEVKQ